MTFMLERDPNYKEMKNNALGLIKQLPKDHDGRNTFIMNYSECEEGIQLRAKHILNRNISQSAKLSLITKLILNK